MVFANPSYLWALLGLVVPLAIHLWSKKEAKTIKIGSIQLLDESNSRQSSSIQLNELLLLLLRMAIVALVVLLLASPKWRSQDSKNQITYLVEPSLANHPVLKTVLDSLSEASSVLLLKKGFPEWEAEMQDSKAETPNYWQLVQGMDSLVSDSIVVFTNAYFRGIKSMRPTTQKKIHWVDMASEMEQHLPLVALQKNQGAQLVTMMGNGQDTWFQKENLADGFNLNDAEDSLRINAAHGPVTVPLLHQDTLKIQMFAAPEFVMDQKYIKASFGALSEFLDQPIIIEDLKEVNQKDAATLHIWLRKEPLKELKGHWLVFKENSGSEHLIESSSNPNVHFLTSRLDIKNTMEEHLSDQLLKLLDLNSDVETLIQQNDERQISLGELKPNYVAPKSRKERASFKDASPWFLVLLLLLMLLERVVSYLKQQ